MERLVLSVSKQSHLGRRDLYCMVASAVVLSHDIPPRLSLYRLPSDHAALFDESQKGCGKVDSFECLRTAMLCDFVYSSENETINLPASYEYIAQYHDPQTGHHAKVIGEYSSSNQLMRLYLINRGTVLTLDSAYIKSAQACLEHVLNTYPGVPVLVAGHSLAGAACLRSTLWAMENNHDSVSACLINPLIGRRPFGHTLTQSQIRAAQAKITYI
jgi:hypothetical protein